MKFTVYKFITIVVLFVGLIFVITQQMSNQKKIEVGDRIPLFSLKDQDGKEFSVKEHVGKKKLVIYFYPKDDTPGCTKEACKFRDEFEVFQNLETIIIGISADDVKSHKDFAEKYRLPFTLLSDSNNEVRRAFGVPGELFGMVPGRVTYIVDLEGKVQYIFNSLFKAEKHIEEAKRILSQSK